MRLAGLRVIAAIDVDAAAVASYAANHPRVRIYVDDLRNLSPRDVRLALRLDVGQLTCLKACPPCQGWSSLGSHRPDDPRNDLVRCVFDWLTELRPKCFLLENVPGLRHDPRLGLMIRQARAIGYGVRLYLADASEFGVPQRRRRLVVVGVRGRAASTFPTRLQDVLPPTFDLAPMSAGRALKLADDIDPLQDPVHRARNPTPTVLRRLRAIPVGGGRFDLPDAERLRCHNDLPARNATASYGRIIVDQPAPTMTTRCTTPACGRFVHPTKPRGLTLREAALLQTFPVDYRFVGTHGQVEAQIGNALPVRMAHAIVLAAIALTRPAAGT